MAVTVHASGTQTAVIATEHFLTSPNVTGSFLLSVDTNTMVAGDTVEVRVYKMTIAGGTSRVAYYDQITGVQPTDGKIWISVAISNALGDTNALRFSLKQTTGTGRAFPWTVERFS